MPRAFFYHVAFLLAMVALAVLRVRYWRRQRTVLGTSFLRKEGTLTEIRQIFAILAFLAIVVQTIYPGLLDRLEFPAPYGIRAVGAALTVVSLVVLARVTNEVMTLLQPRERRSLIKTGVYGRVRHPLFAAAGATAWALTLLSASWVVAVLAAAYSLDLLIRARIDDRRLAEEFGAAYSVYAARVPAFVPRLDSSPGLAR